MTRDGRFKRLIRNRMRRTGESYAVARAVLRRRNGRSTTDTDTDLVERCAVPLAKLLRVSDQAVRHAALRSLSEPQAALLAFWMVHVHMADGVSGLCAGLPHRMVDPNFWKFVQTGLHRLPAMELLQLLEQLQLEVRRCLIGAECDQLLDNTVPLGADELAQLVEAFGGLDPVVMGALDEEYARIAPETFDVVVRFMRAHRDAFAGEGNPGVSPP